jgi:hypothetical protein
MEILTEESKGSENDLTWVSPESWFLTRKR